MINYRANLKRCYFNCQLDYALFKKINLFKKLFFQREISLFFHLACYVRSPVGPAHHCNSTGANSRLTEQNSNRNATSPPIEGATVVSNMH